MVDPTTQRIGKSDAPAARHAGAVELKHDVVKARAAAG